MSIKLTVFLACFVGDGYPPDVVDTCRDLLFESDTIVECRGSQTPMHINPSGAPAGFVSFYSTDISGEATLTFSAPFDSRGHMIANPNRIIYSLESDSFGQLFRDGVEGCECHTRVSNGCVAHQ